MSSMSDTTLELGPISRATHLVMLTNNLTKKAQDIDTLVHELMFQVGLNNNLSEEDKQAFILGCIQVRRHVEGVKNYWYQAFMKQAESVLNPQAIRDV